ncbi:MAG TPA: SdpI family protein [Anaerolineales bacterium]|nr:SdpI family protein [Anaerolineales bacterium]
MSTRTTTIIVLLMILGATLAGLLLWNRLPEQMASHWNVNDQVDGYMSKFWGMFLMPVITLGMFLLFILIPNIDPLKANIAKFRDTFNLFITFITGFMVYVHALTLLWNLGYTNLGIGKAMLPVMGLLFIVIGSLLRKAKRNWFIGIRTPWTLSSDRVWDETHRLGSILFMISGVLAVIGGFFGGMIAFWMLFVPLMGSTIFLVIYSYIFYQKETNA